MGNFLGSIVWLLVLIFIGFPVAFFCSGWYVIVYPLTICCPGFKGFSDFLLKGAQFVYYCCMGVKDGTPSFE